MPKKVEKAAPAMSKNGKYPAEWDTAKPKKCTAVPKLWKDKPIKAYRAVRCALEAEGEVAAISHGLHIGLPRAQAKAYVKELLILIPKEKETAAAKAAGKKPERVVVKREKLNDWEPHFRFPSRSAAERAAHQIARRNGIAQANFHILEENGKFAIAPIHYKPKHAPPVLQEGDEVMDTIIPNSRGIVVGAGPEVSTVRYHDDGAERHIPNYYLYRMADLTKDQKAEIKHNQEIGRRAAALRGKKKEK